MLAGLCCQAGRRPWTTITFRRSDVRALVRNQAIVSRPPSPGAARFWMSLHPAELTQTASFQAARQQSASAFRGIHCPAVPLSASLAAVLERQAANWFLPFQQPAHEFPPIHSINSSAQARPAARISVWHTVLGQTLLRNIWAQLRTAMGHARTWRGHGK